MKKLICLWLVLLASVSTGQIYINGGAIPSSGITFPLLAPDGSASAPSYSFENYPTAGLWITSANSVVKGSTGTGTDANGTGLSLRTGQGTGTGNVGNLQLNISMPAASSGSSANAYQTPFFASSTNGQFILGNLEYPSAPAASVWRATGIYSGVTNTAGARLDIESGHGTGNAAVTEIRLRTPSVAASGNTQQAQANRLTLTEGSSIFSTQVTSSFATSLGWAVVAGADTACNTTCTNACVFGWNLTAGNITGTLLACTDATADACLCAGAS